MDLAVRPGRVLIVLLSVLITGQVAGDGRSDWLKGVQLLAVYLVLGLSFFFLQSASPPLWRTSTNSDSWASPMQQDCLIRPASTQPTSRRLRRAARWTADSDARPRLNR